MNEVKIKNGARGIIAQTPIVRTPLLAAFRPEMDVPKCWTKSVVANASNWRESNLDYVLN